MADQPDLKAELTGGCKCGAVRYKVKPPIRFRPYACHCTLCQSETGSAFSLQLWLLPDQLEVEGDLLEGKSPKPDGATLSLYACPHCFSRIYGSNSKRQQVITLRVGTLDNSNEFVPSFHIWARSKQPWVLIPAGVQVLDTQVNTPEEWIKLIQV